MILALQGAPAPVETVDEQAEALRLATAEVVERIPLPRLAGPIALEVAPLDKQVTLRLPKDSVLAGGRIASSVGALCRKVTIKQDRVELECRSRRMDAAITRDGGQLFLELYELRGLPWRPGVDGPPLVPYPPHVTGLGGKCPGTSPAGKGECAFMEERWVEAAQHFREALATRDRALASLRLGDLALVAADPATAIGWYQRAGYLGPFGRLATARLCELSATCFQARPSLDPHPADLPAPLRNDLLLRRARVYAYLGAWSRSLAVLSDSFAADAERTLCTEAGRSTCRRLVLAALRNTRGAESEAALEVFLALPQRDKGPFAVDLAQAAAEASSRLGAPVFGASLLSVVVPELGSEALVDHLARTAELYLAGRDAVRARVILEFAESRAPHLLAGPRWVNVRRGLVVQDLADESGAGARVEGPSPREQAATALAAALQVSTRARDLLAEIGGSAAVEDEVAGGAPLADKPAAKATAEAHGAPEPGRPDDASKVGKNAKVDREGQP
jgi:hypothetical protein